MKSFFMSSGENHGLSGFFAKMVLSVTMDKVCGMIFSSKEVLDEMGIKAMKISAVVQHPEDKQKYHLLFVPVTDEQVAEIEANAKAEEAAQRAAQSKPEASKGETPVSGQ